MKPWSRRLAHWRAVALRALGLEAAALRLLDRLCQQAPDDEACLALRMQLLALAGAWPAALADSTQVLALQPSSAAHWFNHGYLLGRAERWDEAAQAFERAVRLAPQLDRAWYGLALVRIRQGRLQEAAEALVHNTRLQPLSPHGWYQLARVQLDLGHAQAAGQTLGHLCSFEPRVAAQLARDTGLTVPALP